MRIVQRFISDQRGLTAVMFGLALVPILGMVGGAVDFSRAGIAKAQLQRAADAVALTVVRDNHQGRTHDVDQLFRSVLSTNEAVSGLSVKGTWLAKDEYRVEVTASVRTVFASFFLPQFDLGVSSTAAGHAKDEQVTEVIENKVTIVGFSLSPEAADYNELRVYCTYEDPVTDRRERRPIKDANGNSFESIKIADNTDAGVAAPPKEIDVACGENEQISYHLLNIRNARTNEAARRTNARWDHFTDTTRGVDGRESFNTEYRDLIETIVCDNVHACRPKSEGGIIPNQKRNRDPIVSSRVCEPGMYRYFGWEDRPPHIGEWTDRDYDDIRLVVRCHGTTKTETSGTKPGPFEVRITS